MCQKTILKHMHKFGPRETRRARANDGLVRSKAKIDTLEKGLGIKFDRLKKTTNGAGISRYKQRITDVKTKKALLQKKPIQSCEPEDAFEEKPDHSLRFFANRWK